MMLVSRRLLLACTTLLLLPVGLSHAQEIKGPRPRHRTSRASPSDLHHDEAARPEIEFQTWRTTSKDFDGTIKLGVSYGASAIELYQDYSGFPLVADARLRQWAGMLERNSRH